MKKFSIKINKSEIQKTDNKIEFFNDIIESSIITKCDKLYEEANTFCHKECNKCFDLCDEIIRLNPNYINAYLKKTRCKERSDHEIQILECDNLFKIFPDHSILIKLNLVTIISRVENKKNELKKLLAELSELNDSEIGSYKAEIAYGYDKLNMPYDAIKYYSKYIIENPKVDFAYNNRGIQYEKIGQFQNALNDFKKSIELIDVSKENDYEQRLKRSKNNVLRVESILTYQKDSLTF